MKQFKTAAKASSVMENPVPVEFAINDTEYVANPPNSGQLTLFMAAQASGDGGEIALAMLELLVVILGDEQYIEFENGLKDGTIEMEMVMDIIEFLTEEWSTRPTPSVSVSSQRRAATGKRSTAKPRKKASTRST